MITRSITNNSCIEINEKIYLKAKTLLYKVIKREFSYFELENVKGDAMLKERFDNFMSLYGIKNDKVIKRIIKEINL